MRTLEYSNVSTDCKREKWRGKNELELLILEERNIFEQQIYLSPDTVSVHEQPNATQQ